MPSRDLYIEKDSLDQRAHRADAAVGDQERCSSGATCVIVATVSAIYGIGDPSDYHSMMPASARAATSSAQRDVIARLTEMQYTRNELDFARGTFRVRGDVIDIFPAEHAEQRDRASSCSTTRSSRCSCSIR